MKFYKTLSKLGVQIDLWEIEIEEIIANPEIQISTKVEFLS